MNFTDNELKSMTWKRMYCNKCTKALGYINKVDIQNRILFCWDCYYENVTAQ